MKKKRWFTMIGSICLTLVLAALLLPACAPAAVEEVAPEEAEVAKYEMVFSTQEVDPTTESCLRLFTELVNTRGEGRIELTSYYKAELGAVKEHMDNVMANAINMTSQPSGQLIRLVPWVSVASDLPFAWTDWLAFFQWHESVWIPEVNKELAPHDVMLLPSVGSEGASGIYSASGPIHSPDDTVGKTFRAMSPGIETLWMEALGAKPNVLPWAELFTSMETGMIDLMHNPSSYMIDLGFYEVCDDFTVTEHKRWTYVFIANLTWWNSLPEDIQNVMEDAWFVAAADQKWRIWKLNETYLENMQKPPYNVRVYYPTAEEIAQFKAAMTPVYDWARQEYGDDKVDMMLKYAK